MSLVASSTERRARTLVKWYPKAWRERYGEEFCEALVQEIDDRPRSLVRFVNVAWSGLVSRATQVGLAGLPGGGAVQVRASLAWTCASIATFLAAGLAVWSQLIVGWQWTSPRTAGTTIGIEVMSAGVLVLAVLGMLAVVPVLATVACRMGRGQGRRLVAPVTTAIVSATVLVVGARQFENGWPGTGGHHWSHQGIVPGGVAAFLWAATLAISSYWAHPGALRSFPVREVVWMAVSPLAIVALTASASSTLRRVEMSQRAVRFELRLGQFSLVAMTTILLGAIGWLSDRAPRPHSIPNNLFHVGAIDVVAVVVMACALLCALQAVGRGIGAAARSAA